MDLRECFRDANTADQKAQLIGDAAFTRSVLEMILLPDIVEEIRRRTFVKCKNLKSVTLPKQLQRISREAFKFGGLQCVTIPKGVRKIDENAFYGCEDLKSVAFEDDAVLEEIGHSAFYGSGLESFVAPPSLRRIGDVAFGNCPALKDVRLNEGLQELGWLCFWAAGLTELRVPQQVQKTKS